MWRGLRLIHPRPVINVNPGFINPLYSYGVPSKVMYPPPKGMIQPGAHKGVNHIQLLEPKWCNLANLHLPEFLIVDRDASRCQADLLLLQLLFPLQPLLLAPGSALLLSENEAGHRTSICLTPVLGGCYPKVDLCPKKGSVLCLKEL